jgi:hypothetical protein
LTEGTTPMSTQAIRFCWMALALAAIGCDQPTVSVAPTTSALQARTLLPWDTAVGRIFGDESASEGPMSFALEPDGGALVLDQVNQRVLRLDAEGRARGTIELPSATFEDVEQYEGRAVLALDRLVGKVLRVMDREGALLAEVPVEGRGIENGGSITAMLPRPDGVWLEVDHRHSVKLLDRQLQPCERQVILGRPIANGQSLRAELDGNGGVLVSTAGRAEREAAQTAALAAEAPVERILWLDADARGRVHVVMHEVDRATTAPFQPVSQQYLAVVLDEQLHELSRTPIPWTPTEFEQNVEFRVAPDGHLVQMAFTQEGVLLLAWGRGQP